MRPGACAPVALVAGLAFAAGFRFALPADRLAPGLTGLDFAVLDLAVLDFAGPDFAVLDVAVLALVVPAFAGPRLADVDFA
jgi:hypothetical protein